MNELFRSLDGPLSRTVHVNGQSYLYFGGTAYLGIPQNPDFIALHTEGIKKFGLNNGTSRSNNIQLGIYDEAEYVAAKRFSAESALISSSGYLAAQLTVQTLECFGQIIFAPSTHPALWLDGKPQPPASSFAEWKEKVVAKINSVSQKNWVLISNSMNNLIPEIYNFEFLQYIHPDKNILLIVDDSHGIGVNNKGLSAFTDLIKLKNVECILVASMAKALGVDAGLVLGSEKMIRRLKQSNTFVGASPPSAAALYAFIHGEKIYHQAWEKLQHNMAHFEAAIDLTFEYERGFPAYLIQRHHLVKELMSQNILISSFPYPNPDSEPVTRIVLSSWHEPEDINAIITAIKN